MRGLIVSEKEARRAQVLNGVLEKRYSLGEAARLLGISERHGWRLLAAYRVEGMAALVHGNRGRRPAHATPEEVRAQVRAAASGPYDGANFSHITDLLQEREGITLSRATVSRMLRAAGVRSPRPRRPRKYRSRRERYPQEGMLLQIDGSPHRWLGSEGPLLTLVGAVDDATGTVPHALFRKQEDAQGYFLLLDGIIRTKGIPLALYSDRHMIFAVPEREPETLEEQLAGKRAPTQFGRALETLGIGLIRAHSPQAKGRIERVWQTFQDRLVIELRLAGAHTLEEANRVLAVFLPKFNARFGVPAAQAGLAYRPLATDVDLDGILCFQYERTVAADNTVSFAGRSLQLQPDAQRNSYARGRVAVQERLNGQIVVRYRGQTLLATEAAPSPVTLRARKGSRPSAHAARVDRLTTAPQAQDTPAKVRISHKPAQNHPWRLQRP